MKKIMHLLLLAFFALPVFSQPKNWHHMDLQTDTIFGISTGKAYSELLKNKKAAPVIVAVIDSGVDTTHEDLHSELWVNAKEKYNGVDDDRNGYTDDKFGWSFIEGIKYDNLELTRILREQRSKGDTLGDYQQLKNEYLKKYRTAVTSYNAYKAFSNALKAISDSLQTLNPTIEQLQNFKPVSAAQDRMLKAVTAAIQQGIDFSTFKKAQIDKGVEHFNDQVQYHLNLNFIPPPSLGSNNVTGADAEHGTHVAGIIAADRDNKKGIEGIASAVRIMCIRTVPNGDERDEDVAKAIRYAVDNGAKIINMSFGKPYSPGKQLVDDAVRYAMQKDVLMVHGAGNDNNNLDSIASFPTRKYLSGNEAAAWIEVGASGPKNDETLKATFSNYGKMSVDVFAPGVSIYSTTPGSTYTAHDGTSMAAPVVAGIAALIRSYYPKLTAIQVKDIISRSVIKTEQLADKCRTGGVVNAYEALKLAAVYKKIKK